MGGSHHGEGGSYGATRFPGGTEIEGPAPKAAAGNHGVVHLVGRPHGGGSTKEADDWACVFVEEPI